MNGSRVALILWIDDPDSHVKVMEIHAADL